MEKRKEKRMQIKSTMHEDRMALVIKGNAWSIEIYGLQVTIIYCLPASSFIFCLYYLKKKN